MFPLGFGAKKDRGRGFSVLTEREMKRVPALLLAPFVARSLTLVPRSLLLNRTETLATQATFNLKRGIESKFSSRQKTNKIFHHFEIKCKASQSIG